jgi:hypothetical protein
VVGGQPGVCYVICGAGGGTGGGASPLVLRAARAAGHLAVAVVTLPFSFEGPRRVRQSRATVAALQEAADLVFGEEEFTAMAVVDHLPCGISDEDGRWLNVPRTDSVNQPDNVNGDKQSSGIETKGPF